MLLAKSNPKTSPQAASQRTMPMEATNRFGYANWLTKSSILALLYHPDDLPLLSVGWLVVFL